MGAVKELLDVNYNIVYYTPEPSEPYYAAMQKDLENDVNLAISIKHWNMLLSETTSKSANIPDPRLF